MRGKPKILKPATIFERAEPFHHAQVLAQARFGGPDTVFTTTVDRTLLRWSLTTGGCTELPMAADAIEVGTRRLVALDRPNHTLSVLDLASGEWSASLPCHATLLALPADDDGTLVAVESGKLRVLELVTGKWRTLALEIPQSTLAGRTKLELRASADGGHALLVAQSDPAGHQECTADAFVLDVATGAQRCKLRLSLPAHGRWSLDPRGRFVTCVTPDAVQVFDAATGARLYVWRFELEHSGDLGVVMRQVRRIESCVDLADGQLLLFARKVVFQAPAGGGVEVGHDEYLTLDLASQTIVRRFRPVPYLGTVTDARGRWILCAGRDRFTVRDSGTGMLARTPEGMHGHTSAICSVAFVGEGHEVASVSNGQVLVWDLSRRELARSLGEADDFARGGVLSPNGRYALGLGGEGFGLWDIAGGKRIACWPAPEHAPIPAALDRMGGIAVLAGTDEDILSFLHTADGRLVQAQRASGDDGEQGYEDLASHAALSPDGCCGVATTWWGDTAYCFASLDGKQLRTIKAPEPITCMAFSADGKRLFAAARKRIHVSSVETGAAVQKLDGVLPTGGGEGDGIYVVVADPSGRLLAASGSNPTIQIWSLARGARVAALRGHECAVVALAFDRSGRWLVSGDQSGTIALWDLDDVVKPPRSGQ